MPLAALLLLAGASADLKPTDFLPLAPNRVLVYQEEGPLPGTTEDRVGAPTKIGGAPATPVTTTQAGREIAKVYYRVDSTGAYLVADRDGKPLPEPMPLFRFENGKPSNWTYTRAGTGKADSLQAKGAARFGAPRDVLGRRVATLEVRVEAVVGAPGPTEAVVQEYVYGDGVGLIESRSQSKVGKAAIESVIRLVRIEEAKAGN